MHLKNIITLLLLLFSLQASVCQTTSSPYELDLKSELAYLGSGVALSVTGHILENQVDPLTPQEIDQLSAESIWEVDRAPLSNYSPEVALTTDRLSVVGWIMPLGFAIPSSTRKDLWTLGVMGAETVLITHGLASIFKGTTQRVRPFVYYDAAPLAAKTDVDAKKSFFSGHTSNFSTLSFFTAKVISDYSSNQTVEVVAWSIAAVSSGTMGYLRIKSGKHFFTDVLAGYLVGAAVGIAIPELHRVDRNETISLTPYYDFQSSGFHLVVAF